jgi:hypothetical protein
MTTNLPHYLKSRTFLFILLLLALAGCRPQPPLELVIEGRTKLIYDCNKFKSQLKTDDDIISLRARAVDAFWELDEERTPANLALQDSLRRALDAKDKFRIEKVLVNYKCEKLRRR